MRVHSLVRKVVLFSLSFATVACGTNDSLPVRSSVSQSGESAVIAASAGSVAGLGVGDIMQQEFAGSGLFSIDLSQSESDAEYILAVLNLNVGGPSSTVYLNNLSAAPEPSLHKSLATHDDHDDHATSFHDALRAHEQVTAAQVPATSVSKSAFTAAPEPELGQLDNFDVIASVNSLERTTTVEAELYCIGEHILYYVDTEVARRNPQDFTRNDVNALCERFDVQAGEMHEVFGEASDVDGNDRVVVLSSPQVNRLGSLGGGVITGFFFSNDLHGGNFAEILYTVVPDAKGIYGLSVPRDIAIKNLIPAVLPHELQHAINYAQHVMFGNGKPEESWLNEAISHVAEDHWGVGMENPSRYAMFLDQPQVHSLVTSSSPGLVSRGGMYLLARYLYEQAPDREAFLSRLVQGTETGVTNVEMALASPDPQFDEFSEFMMRWSAALALNGTGVSSDARLRYGERIWSDSSDFYAGVCTYCIADDNRGTVIGSVAMQDYRHSVSVAMNPSTVSFYRVSASQREVELWGVGDGRFGAVLMRIQ